MGEAKKNEKKVDQALEVVESLEESGGKPSAPAGTASSTQAKQPAARSGLRFKFSMDAMVSESDTQTSKDRKLRPGASQLLNIDFTVPYLWRIPVFGKTALKMIRRIQREEYPESVREILKSLRQ